MEKKNLIRFITLLSVFLCLPIYVFGEVDSVSGDIEIKTAVVHYKEWLTPGREKATKLVLYKDGNKKAVETFNEMGEKTRLEFFDGENSYQILLPDRIAIKLDNPLNLLNMYYFKDELEKKYFVKKDEFLGRECNVYDLDNSLYYFWNRIMLRREFSTSFMGISSGLTTEADNIEVNISIPQDKFKVPNGVRLMTFREYQENKLKK